MTSAQAYAASFVNDSLSRAWAHGTMASADARWKPVWSSSIDLKGFGYPNLDKQGRYSPVEKLKQKKTRPVAKRSEVKPVELVNSIDYQEGSVVSRTIIDERTGTVTLFAFDENQGLSEHTAPFDALVFVLEGDANITIAGKMFRLKEGQMIIMPAHQPHAVEASTRFKMLLIMVKPIL